MWTFLFKHHGLPPNKGSRYPYFLGYAIAVALDLLLTVIIVFHLFSPLSNFRFMGHIFFFVLPGMTFGGPLLGIAGCFIGSPGALKLQSSFNTTAVLVNYPLTLIAMLWLASDPFYICVLILLGLNKIAISYTGAKVRQHWINPGFSKNYAKIQDRFRSLIQAKSEAKAGIKTGMTAQERASSLVNSDLPSPLKSSGKKGQG